MKVKNARFVVAATRRQDLLSDGLRQVAFVGRSNVGKSSLLNRLLGRRALARTSSTPGKTRAVNYFLIDSSYYLVDLPGYGFAKTSKTERQAWARLLDRYFSDTRPRPRVVQLIDAKVGATRLDVDAVAYLRGLVGEPSVVATKVDRVPKSQRQRRLREIREELGCPSDVGPIPCSAKTGEGIPQLWKEISSFLRDHREDSMH